MAKPMKKVQQAINGGKQTKEDVETYSKKEVKQGENWLNKRLTEQPTESRSIITVGNLIDWKKSGTMYFPLYQREEVWDDILKQALIHTLVNKGHIPDMVFAQKNGKYENIDGKQRITTFEGMKNNKFPLPTSIPQILGGGGLFKDADERLQNYILSRTVGYTYLIDPTEKICQDTFLHLQQGVKLTIGEIIHGNYGHVAEYVDHVARTHPITKVLPQKRFLHYRMINAMLLLESKYANSVDQTSELAFVNSGQNNEMFDSKIERTFQKTLNRLNYVCGGDYLRELSLLRSVTLYVWLRRNMTIGKTKKEGREVNGFLNRYYKNMAEVSNYMQSRNNVILREDALGYYTQQQQRRTSPSQMKLMSNHLDEQWELFKNKKMEDYVASAGNMCLDYNGE